MNAKPARKLRRDLEIGQELPRAARSLRQITTTSQKRSALSFLITKMKRFRKCRAQKMFRR